MTKAQIRAMCAESGVEPPEPTPEEKYARRKKQLEDYLAVHPDSLWAKNELKYMTVDDFSEHKRPLVRTWPDAACATRRCSANGSTTEGT